MTTSLAELFLIDDRATARIVLETVSEHGAVLGMKQALTLRPNQTQSLSSWIGHLSTYEPRLLNLLAFAPFYEAGFEYGSFKS